MHSSLIADVERAIASGSAEKRVETLRRVTSLFLDESDRLNDAQVEVFDDVLMHLIERIEGRALEQLSAALAPIDNAPYDVTLALANNDDVTIAGPVLMHSKRLTDTDLVGIAQTKSQQHMLAMSGRDVLSENVTDVLVDRGNMEVAHRLARNSGARFSARGFAQIVKRSEGDEKLAEKLGLRLDIPIQLLRNLLARATKAVRERLLALASPERREEIQRALEAVADEVGREASAPRDFRRAEAKAYDMNRRGKLNEAVLCDFAQRRCYEDMTATLSLMSASKPELIEKLLKAVEPDGVIIACKAAYLTWPTAHEILNARFTHHQMSEQEALAAMASFFELSQGAAQRALRFMAVQNTIKKSA